MHLTGISLNRILTSHYTLLVLWVVLAVVSAIINSDSNNFDIYCRVFRHTVNETSLFAEYPAEYHDMNHYGPLFSIIVAPFAILPRWMGLVLWHIALALFLFWTIRCSTFTWKQQLIILWFCTNELFTALSLSQFNIATVGLILLSWVFCEKGKIGWATLCIVVGTFVKLYGIVGLVFFLFLPKEKRLHFLLWLIGWGALAFILPMLISSPSFVVSQYGEWYNSLTSKNTDNLFAFYQNISVLGMVRKISGCGTYSDLWLIIPGVLLLAFPLLRVRQYGNVLFRRMTLASMLMFVVLFSTGSESCSYIIALVGVAIWYCSSLAKRTGWDIALFVLVFVVSSLSPTDIFPQVIRKAFIQPYALKALPVFMVWLKLIWEMCNKNFRICTK